LGVGVTIQDFDHFDFSNNSLSHTVYTRGSGRAVILCHELPGMTQQCIDFAEELVVYGFRVYLPLFYGKPGDNEALSLSLRLFCLKNEFKVFSENGGSPLADWLRALCLQAHQDCGGDGVGMIGMCLTGNFAISLMADPVVLASVSSQPALPFSFYKNVKSSLAISDDEKAEIVRRAQVGTELMCLRFSNDKISPREKFDALNDLLGASFRGIEIKSPDPEHNIPARAHSVLTMDFCNQAGHPTRQARDQVLAFLASKLH
jgi:dienelactone hydrolase